MKLKDGFILRTVAGETVVLPASGVTNFDMMITLNDTGKFLWERLAVGAEEADLVKDLLAEYDVSEELATESVAAFVARLKELDFLAWYICSVGTGVSVDAGTHGCRRICAVYPSRHQYASYHSWRTGSSGAGGIAGETEEV